MKPSQTLKEMLSRRQVSQESIAQKTGVRPATVSQVVAGRISSARIVGEIARALNLSPEQVKAAIPNNGVSR